MEKMEHKMFSNNNIHSVVEGICCTNTYVKSNFTSMYNFDIEYFQ
jgi:hypothetical protein